MTISIGAELPSDLQERFRPEQIGVHAHKVVLIVTVDQDGFPHPAMLSHFEIVLRDACNLRIAAYADSGTTNNMRRSGRTTMIVVDRGVVYYIKGRAEEVRSEMRTVPNNALMNFRIESVRADQADASREGETNIVSGITYDASIISNKLSVAAAVFAEMLT